MSLNNNINFKNYELLVVSPGGSCQSIIMNLIKKTRNIHMNDVNDSDNLKHLSNYQNSVFNCNSFKKILYVYRDPLSVINSHFRRGWYKMQYKKISSFLDYNKEHLFDNKHNLFDSCIKDKKDNSNVSKHLDNWISYPGKIYFLNIDSPNKKELFDFLGFEINGFDKIVFQNKYEDKIEVTNFFKNINEDCLSKIKNRNNK